MSIDALKAKIKETEASTELDEGAKSRLVELYRQTIGHQEAASANAKAADDFARARETAAKEAEEVRKGLEEAKKTSPEESLNVSDQTSAEEIEQLLIKEKADLAAVETKATEVTTRLDYEPTRNSEVQQRLVEARKAQKDIAAELKKTPPADEPPAVTQARRWLLESRFHEFSTETKRLDEELLSQPMRIQLLEAQRDRQAHSVQWITTRVRLLEGLLAERRQVQAFEAVEEAEAAFFEAEGKHPLVQEIASKNIALSDEITKITGELEKAAAADEGADKEAKSLADELRSTRQKLEIAGLNQALGQILLEQRRRLPDPASFRKRARKREAAISEATLRQIQHEEERERLRDMGAYLDQLTQGLPPDEVEPIQEELQGLLENRVNLLQQAIRLDRSYLRALGELDFAQRQLLETVEEYNAFLGKNLLWLRSAPLPNLALLGSVPTDVAELLSPRNWTEVLAHLIDRFTHSPMIALILLVFGVLKWKSRRMWAALRATGASVGKPRRDRFGYSLQALGLTLLVALPWPLLLAVVGWQLGVELEGMSFSRGVSVALIGIAPPLLYLLAFRALCHREGLAARHFRWSEPVLTGLRRAITSLTVVLIPVSFVTIILTRMDTSALGEGLERLTIVVMLAALGAFFYRLFEPKRCPLHSFYEAHPASWLSRLRHLWLVLSIGIPGALIILTVVGYVLTAGMLTRTLVETMWLLLALVIVHQMIVRWLLLIRRRLAFEAAVERRRAAREEEETHAPGAEVLEVAEQEVDFVAMDQESRELLNTALTILGIFGVWWIWAPVLPAFGIFDQITLWHHAAVVEGEQKLVPVTLASIGIAALIAVITLVAIKRFPSLLAIILLQRLKMTPGGRYAAETLSSYVIAAVGGIWVFSMLGIDWSKLQWLVAALGVGIGFGLQEIVANFISGLIILFERPIRVGDVVTVGDTDGVVTRIQIRATTIRNWDRKELLVPNKEFITGRLLNWSLSDQTTRVVIPVGVAYGTDAEQAMKLMLETAQEHERVIEDPAPFTTFESFGDNALTLYLRCYLDSLEFRLATITELHTAINKKFNEAGIVIAFPQRDVHLDTTRPLDIRIQHQEPDAEPTGKA
ncbi:MAG: mechanosensitive ion channel [Chromatiales bacterium]